MYFDFKKKEKFYEQAFLSDRDSSLHKNQHQDAHLLRLFSLSHMQRELDFLTCGCSNCKMQN